MFTLNHYIWMAASLLLIIFFLWYVSRKQYSLNDILTACCIICVVSEVTKILCSIQIVSSADGTWYTPYLPTSCMPLHLCSLQILTVFYTRFSKNEKNRTIILGFMYPTCIIGALNAILLPSVFNAEVTVDQAFTHPIVYQYFLFHTMLIFLGICIVKSKEIQLERKHYKSTMIILSLVSFCSLYVNSILAAPVYKNGILQSVEFTPNYFLSYHTPLGLGLTQKWQWLLYFFVLVALAFIIIRLMYIPIYKRKPQKCSSFRGK